MMRELHSCLTSKSSSVFEVPLSSGGLEVPRTSTMLASMLRIVQLLWASCGLGAFVEINGGEAVFCYRDAHVSTITQADARRLRLMYRQGSGRYQSFGSNWTKRDDGMWASPAWSTSNRGYTHALFVDGVMRYEWTEGEKSASHAKACRPQAAEPIGAMPIEVVEALNAIESELCSFRSSVAIKGDEVARREQCMLLYLEPIKRAWGADRALWPSDTKRSTVNGEMLPVLASAFDRLVAAEGTAQHAKILSSISLADVLGVAFERVTFWNAHWKDVKVCSVCYEPTPAKFMGYGHMSDTCGHGPDFCSPCLHKFAAERLDAGAVSTEGLHCPAVGCSQALPKECTAMVLTAEQELKLQRLKRNAVISADANLRWCPQPDCETAIDTTDRSYAGMSTAYPSTVTLFAVASGVKEQLPSRQVPCPKCANCICTGCGAPAHEGRCEDAADKNLEELAKRMGWKSCPLCHNILERTEGCNQMQCRHLGCQKTFCYGCGKKKCAC